jgi:hypothetical protein
MTRPEQIQRIDIRRDRVAASIRREPWIPTKALASLLGVSASTIYGDIRWVVRMQGDGE